jgi:hypothetical protein
MSFQVKHLSDRCCKSLSFQVNLFVAPDKIVRNVYLLWWQFLRIVRPLDSGYSGAILVVNYIFSYNPLPKIKQIAWMQLPLHLDDYFREWIFSRDMHIFNLAKLDLNTLLAAPDTLGEGVMSPSG